uniref:Uncharacterized protein n=1 Tax=viral metagenome TaxID=1070528 RepID=A0A6H1ZD95_9ZZZZ
MRIKEIFCRHEWISESCYMPSWNAYEFRSKCLKCGKVTIDKDNKKEWTTKQDKHYIGKQYIWINGEKKDLYEYENFNPNNPGGI